MVLEKSVTINVEGEIPEIPKEIEKMPPATIAILTVGGTILAGGLLYMIVRE